MSGRNPTFILPLESRVCADPTDAVEAATNEGVRIERIRWSRGVAVTRVGGDAGEADVAPARRATVGRPTTSTPTRRRGSVRRTTTHDSTRREGLDGPITLVAQGRDLVTRS